MPVHSAILCQGWEGAAKAKLGISETTPGSFEEGGVVTVGGGVTGVFVGVAVGVGITSSTVIRYHLSGPY